MKNLLIIFVIVVALGLFVYADAMADPISHTDFATVSLGALIASKTVDIHESFTNNDIGDVLNQVYYNGGIYTYVETITPTINYVSEVNTIFEVLGFNDVAGYSFSEAADAEISVGSLDIDLDGTLDWGQIIGWDAGETLTLFYQSASGPAVDSGYYQVINHSTGWYTSYSPGESSPVPEPGTLFLLGSGLLGLAGLGKSFSKKGNTWKLEERG